MTKVADRLMGRFSQASYIYSGGPPMLEGGEMRLAGSLALIAIGILLTAGVASCTSTEAYAQPSAAQTTHNTIIIEVNSSFNASNGVTGGTGTAVDPFIIAGLDINASEADGIRVANTSVNFVITNVSAHNGGKFDLDGGMWWPSYSGMVLDNVVGCTLENLVLNTNAYGMEIEDSANIVIRNCTFIGNSDGIRAYNSANLTITDCRFYGQRSDGLSMSDCDELVVARNLFETNYGGISCGSSSNITIEANSFERTGQALSVDYSTNSSVLSNTFKNNEKMAMVLRQSSDIIVKGNLVTGNSNGIGLFDSNRITISENDFVGNTMQAYDDSTDANSWNDSAKGNFWSDYRGHDGDGDGLGDSPYEITTGVRDARPLMHPVNKQTEKGISSMLVLAVVLVLVAVSAILIVAILRTRRAGPGGPPRTEDTGGA
jgi:parallel beta-helix repeat protein